MSVTAAPECMFVSQRQKLAWKQALQRGAGFWGRPNSARAQSDTSTMDQPTHTHIGPHTRVSFTSPDVAKLRLRTISNFDSYVTCAVSLSFRIMPTACTIISLMANWCCLSTADECPSQTQRPTAIPSTARIRHIHASAWRAASTASVQFRHVMGRGIVFFLPIVSVQKPTVRPRPSDS